MNSEMIRNADIEDFDSIFLLLEQLWPYHKLHKEELFEIYKLSLESGFEYSVCYVKDNKVLGFAAGNIQNVFYRAGKLFYVSVLIVDSDYRGQGIGVKLMDHVKRLAVENKCKAIELDSGFHREQAHIFYEKYGFKKTAYKFELEYL